MELFNSKVDSRDKKSSQVVRHTLRHLTPGSLRKLFPPRSETFRHMSFFIASLQVRTLHVITGQNCRTRQFWLLSFVLPDGGSGVKVTWFW